MKQKDFLTVMAVLDDDTQRKLASVQRKLFSAGLMGTQTMDIPFHVTLGSFPAEREKALSGQIAQAAVETGKFPIVLKRWNTFGFRVLFAEPDIPEELKALHVLFDCNYADGCPWSPHCTLFVGKKRRFGKHWP